MTRVQGIKEAAAFLVTTALSCGPSQLFGSIKLIVDSCLILVNYNRKSNIKYNYREIQNNWPAFKTSSTAALVAKKLGLKSNDLTEELAANYFKAKYIYTKNKIKRLVRSLRADAYALIPLVGAHISWRVATDYKGKSFTPIFSRAVEQLLEHSKSMASRPLFLGRIFWGANDPKEDKRGIKVSTSTKQRTIQIYSGFTTLTRNDKGMFIIPSWTEVKQIPTVVLFHPNMGGAEGMADSAEFYREKGYNTLAVTLGGYEGSPGVTTSEKSMYQDVEAVKKWLVDRGVTRVAYHGFSLGSGAALQAATGASGTKLKTLFVALDKPYSSAAAVGENMAGSLGRGVLAAGCPVGLKVELPGGLWTKTDGLDNLRKAAILKQKKIPLICFEAKEDSLMGRKKVNGEYTENFARDLLRVRYDNAEDRSKNLVSLPGGHGDNSLRAEEYWSNNPPIPNLHTRVLLLQKLFEDVDYSDMIGSAK